MKKNKNKIVAGILLLAILSITAFIIFSNTKEKENTDISYSDLIKKIDEQQIEKIEMMVGSTTLDLKLKDDDKKYKVIVPNTQAFIELVQEKIKDGKDVNLIQNKQPTAKSFFNTMFSLLPTFIFVGLFIALMKMQGFGDKGKIYGTDENKSDVTFEDVAGLDEEKEELIEIVTFLKKPQRFHEMGAKIPRGVLLCGKPGTGKTLIAKAIAGEAGVPFISMSGSEFIELFAGLGASRVRKLFEKAKKVSPCIVFIDEIDAIGARRSGGNGSDSENNQTLNQLLVEMDGFETEQTVIVLAATNRPEMLDKALVRPGRFDRQILIPSPDKKGREEILKIHSKNKKIEEGLDLKELAGDTAGFTGAELANILNEAAIIATKKQHTSINSEDLQEAVKKVMIGLEKHNRVILEKEKKLTAYHEAGHAIVSNFLETQTDVKEISIIPRGLTGGYTMYKSNEDKYYTSKTEMKEELIALLGGRAAEKIALNDISTGASNDIEVATKIAKNMVTVYGMSDVLGPISLKDEEYKMSPFGEDINDVVGIEVKKLIDEAYINAQKILSENIDKLDLIAKDLLEKEKLTEEDFKKFFN